MSLITIGLPVYNCEKYIKDCIDSILNQTYSEFKLIIVNDGSIDNSVLIVSQYSDPRILFINDGENKGLSFRLNQITKLVDTKYLVRMDADDIMHPKRLEKQLAILENNSEIDLIGSNAFTINGNSEVIGVRLNIADSIVEVESFIHPTVMGKSSWFKNNLYDNYLFRIEDVELWYRTKEKSKFYCTLSPLIYYREIPGNYYKKYLVSTQTIRQLIFKYKLNIFWVFFVLKQFVMALIYFSFNLFSSEIILIERRNNLKVNNKSISEIENDYNI
jgi:glycosyltransferase involved in cell wall biosynthesis